MAPRRRPGARRQRVPGRAYCWSNDSIFQFPASCETVNSIVLPWRVSSTVTVAFLPEMLMSCGV
jgi:hypothetical protein